MNETLRQKMEEMAEKYAIKWHNTYTDGMTVAKYCNSEVPETCFIAGFAACSEIYEAKLDALKEENRKYRDALEEIIMYVPADSDSRVRMHQAIAEQALADSSQGKV